LLAPRRNPVGGPAGPHVVIVLRLTSILLVNSRHDGQRPRFKA
jgi:hypothetical protein